MTSFTHKSIEAVAIFEATKGAIVVAAGFGILRYAHHDVRVFAEELVELFHLNPASRYPALFIHAAENLGHMHLMTLASIGIAYASLRFVEAYGLWRERKWAEWLAAASGAIYIPIEITHLRPGHLLYAGIALAVNAAVVGLMLRALFLRRAKAKGTSG